MISIVIPIFNSEKYLLECLNSVLNQSFSDFEVLCINDGSIDRSKEICEQYVRKDKRFRLYNQKMLVFLLLVIWG